MAVTLEIHTTRPYFWGAIYAFDADRAVPDSGDLRREGEVWTGPDCVVIGVQHASTAPVSENFPSDAPIPPAEVGLRIQVRDEPVRKAMHEVSIDVPSGILNIGDADKSEDLQLRPGRWRLQINLSSLIEATSVEVYVSPS